MRLTVWLLGAEIITISTDRPDEPTELPGAIVERHAGDFPLGFHAEPVASWTPGDVEATTTAPQSPSVSVTQRDRGGGRAPGGKGPGHPTVRSLAVHGAENPPS